MKTWRRGGRLPASALALSLCLPLFSGCSVFMAASGEEDPEVELVRQGSSRQVVESVLGQPIGATPMPDGTLVCEYQYEAGNAPSTSRAVGHAVLDVATLGIWEAVGSGYELSRGTTYHARVTYDDHSVVRSVSIHEDDS